MLPNTFKNILKKIIVFIVIISVIFFIANYIKGEYNTNKLLKINEFVKKSNISDFDIKEFRRINSENILLDKKQINKVRNPIISIILTNYNQFHCIHKSIRSIQNQSIKNLEIIIIDDYSSDNSTEIIKNYQKEDNRIILIAHKTNKGKIKSRSDGIKIAKGKFITILDGDDALIHKDILKNCLYIASIGNLDVVEFKMMTFIRGKLNKWENQYNMSTYNIIYQPELRTKFFSLTPYIILENRSICAKLIKNKILKKVINRIGQKYTEDYFITYEDTIMVITLFQIANSYYYMKEEGYYYSKDDKIKNLSKKNQDRELNEKIIKGMDPIKFLQFLIEKTRNTKVERQLIYNEIILADKWWCFYKNINHHFKMVYNILDTMIKSRFLLNSQKERLILIKNSLMAKEKNLLKISIKK
jgi:glycosyltransferase involved in cell wall biosynthesis